jgi:hypothetical protein
VIISDLYLFVCSWQDNKKRKTKNMMDIFLIIGFISGFQHRSFQHCSWKLLIY